MDIFASQQLIVVPEGKICDYIDQKLRSDTPEEYVRQTIEKRLVKEHKYLKEQIRVEFTIKSGSRKPRIDLAVFPKDCTNFVQEEIYIIVECKKETVERQNKKEGIEQLKSYMSDCLNCEWGLWTNGKDKVVLRKVRNERGKREFVEWNDIPSADGTAEDIDRPKRNGLRTAVEDNLLFVFRTCHNHIYAMDGLQKQPAFFEFLKVIFCKIEDEKNVGSPLEFYTTSNERSNVDGQLTVKNRIAKIFDRVKRKYGKIFSTNDEIVLSPRSLAYVVSELQKYSLLNTHIDIKGRAYEEIVGSNLRGDRGEFFTPRNIMKMTVEMVDPQHNERVCDASCGTGGFLVLAMTHIIEKLKKDLEKDLGKPEKDWTFEEQTLLRHSINEKAASNFFGFDLNPDLVKATKMNMVMNNDGSGNILQTNSLLPPHEWTADFKSKLATALDINSEQITNHRSIGFFDVIVTNPPFGSKIPIIDHQILEQYDLGHNWKKNEKGEWYKTDALQGSVPPEQLFIERCLQFLKPGGRLGIVLPDSILGNPNLGYLRTWLISKTNIIASLDLHPDTFQPYTGVQTSILILQKKTDEEIRAAERAGQMDYQIFMAIIDKVGHDKRGTPIYKRDQHGNELLRDADIIELDETADGTKTATSVSKEKILDDQTLDVPQIFHRWRKEENVIW